MRSRALRSCAVAALCVLLTACEGRTPAIELRVERTRQHPLLADHDRVLAVIVDGERRYAASLCSDPGEGVPLHFVECPDGIVVVDANGMWYRVTGDGIERLGWRWEEPLPRGVVKRIALDPAGRYVTTTPVNATRSDIYKYKDPPDARR